MHKHVQFMVSIVSKISSVPFRTAISCSASAATVALAAIVSSSAFAANEGMPAQGVSFAATSSANGGMDQPGYRCTALQVTPGGNPMPAYGQLSPTQDEAEQSAMDECRFESRWGGTCMIQNCWHHE